MSESIEQLQKDSRQSLELGVDSRQSLEPVKHEHAGGCCSSSQATSGLPVLGAGTCSTNSDCCAPSATASSVLCEDSVRDALKAVIDPELFVNIVDLGLIYDVDIQPIDDGKLSIKVEMTMTSPMCPAGPQLVGQTQSICEGLPNVGSVEVKVVMDPPWSPDKMTEDARDQLGIF
jgi:metal-sulfur cluster biosynthetic enzyme